MTLQKSAALRPEPGVQTGPGDATPRPPEAPREPHHTAIHGQVLADPYFWLRDRDDPRVIAYLEAENRYARAIAEPFAPLRDRLLAEMESRLDPAEVSPPMRWGTYCYYYRAVPGHQHRLYCRRPLSNGGAEEILLDLERVAGDGGFLDTRLRVSPDHRLLAYATDTVGREIYRIRVKDLHTGEILPDTLLHTSADIEWASDSRTLYYVTVDPTVRPHQLRRHRIGLPEQDELLYVETDPHFAIELSRSRSGQFLFMTSSSNDTVEVRFLATDGAGGPLRLLRDRQPGVELAVEHHSDQFYVLTNQDAPNFKLMQAPIADPIAGVWREVVGHRDDVTLEELEVYRDHLILYRRVAGQRELRILELSTGSWHDLRFSEPACTVTSARDLEFDSSHLGLVYTSLVTPPVVLDYDLHTRTRTLRWQQPVPGYDPSRYRAERIQAIARDGAAIPISLVYRRDLRRDQRQPCLLVGYGAYGSSFEPTFDSARVSLLDRGFVFAIAHVRGGAERGRAWYNAGHLTRKQRSLDDFVDAAEHLIAAGYTAPDRLAIRGKSAGGLLIGSLLNRRPDLVCAAIADVPFVDVVNTLLDPSIPLSVSEWQEWGDPRDRDDFDNLRAYSPYDNVSRQPYPHLLVRAALEDSRVPYWEPAKWVARLRACKTDRNLLLLHTRMRGSHSGASGRYHRLHDRSLDFSFLIATVGGDDAPNHR